MRSLILSCIFLFFIQGVQAETSQFETLKAQKDAAVKRVTDPIEDLHKAELEKLLGVLTAAGDLEGAVAVKKEIEKPLEGSPGAAKEDERLKFLRERRKTEIQRTTDPIYAKYQVELEKLLNELTRAGKLDEALKVKNEIALLQGTPEDELPGVGGSEFAREIIGSTWEIDQPGGKVRLVFNDGNFRVHKEAGDGSFVPGDIREWKMEDPERRRIRIFWHYGEEVATVNSKITTMKDTKHVMRRVEN